MRLPGCEGAGHSDQRLWKILRLLSPKPHPARLLVLWKNADTVQGIIERRCAYPGARTITNLS